MWGIPVPASIAAGGLGWGRMIRSGSGVPADALGNLGDRYFDTAASRWYLKRWVANREGAGDSILFPINLFPRVGDFSISMLIRLDNTPDLQQQFVCSSPNGFSAFQLRCDVGTRVPSASLRSSDGTSQHFLGSGNALDSAWHSIGESRVGGRLSLLRDGLEVGFIADTSGWTPKLTETGTSALSTLAGATSAYKACNLSLTGPGGSIIAPLDEGAGTVITNRAGANGTLTDGAPTNFWAQAWVPMDLL